SAPPSRREGSEAGREQPWQRSCRAGKPALQRQLREVASAVEDQRLGARASLARLDLADEDDVVAFLVAAAVEALERGGGAVEQRHAARARAEGDAVEARHVLAREALGERALVGGEDVDGVVRAARERRHRAGLAREAPED